MTQSIQRIQAEFMVEKGGEWVWRVMALGGPSPPLYPH